MPIPAYMWLKDDGGADIKDSVEVKDRRLNGEKYSRTLRGLMHDRAWRSATNLKP